MEKNCTNCKYNIPVNGADYGFCNHKNHLGMKANEHTLCSEYEVQEEPTHNDEEVQEVLLGLKCCTDPKSKGCAECPFARYKCTCQQDLMFAARQIISRQLVMIEGLVCDIGGYVVDQGIWLNTNAALEKENEELKEKKAFYKEKASTLAEDYESLKHDTDRLEFKLSDALQLNAQLTKSNEELWDSYHQGYDVGYAVGKQDALTAEQPEPSKERPEVEG